MSINYIIAPKRVVGVANEIITKYHSELKEEKILYLLRISSWKRKGNEILGQAKKCSEIDMLLNDYTFIIILNSLLLPNEDILSIVIDHELSHCGVERDANGKIRRFIVPHDLNNIGQFTHIAKRYNLNEQEMKFIG